MADRGGPGGELAVLVADLGGHAPVAPGPSGLHRPDGGLRVLREVLGELPGIRPLDGFDVDGVAACCERSTDAVRAAIELQRSLAGRPGFDEAPPRVAVHSVQVAGSERSVALGASLSFAACLCGAGNPGQILLSATGAAFVAAELPEGVVLVDMGSVRLNDLGRRQRVWRATHPSVFDVAASLVSLDGLPQNLPLASTPLIGRRTEVRTLVELVDVELLVTLTGAAGVGKTRLAAQVGAEVAARYPGGVWWVDLAPLTDPTAVSPALLAAMGVSEDGLRPALEVAVDRLVESGRAMVVLDNCEHLTADAAAVAHELTASSADVVVLATSREPLGLPGEITWRVPSLAVPPVGASGELHELERFDSVRLFMERARRVRRNMVIENAQASAVVEICNRLDGIPLAIEFAAARCRQFSPARIASELSDRFRLLTGRSNSMLPRHQTLLASVEWSHDLLDDDERRVLRRLGVFSGVFRLQSAEAVVVAPGDVDRWTVLDVLGRLVDKNLVQLESDSDEGEYRLLETVRQFALDRARELGELGGLRDAHADWWIAELRALDARQPSAQSIALCARYAPDLRSALDWLEPDLPRRYKLLAHVALNWAWCGRTDDVVAFVHRWLLDGPPPGHESEWASAYGACGNVCYSAVQERAAPHNNHAIDIMLRNGDARALLALGIMLVADTDERTTLQRSVAAVELGVAAGADRLLSAFGPVFLLWISASDRVRAERFTELVHAAIRRDCGPHDVYRTWLAPIDRPLSSDHFGRLPLPSFSRAETFILDRLLVADVASFVPLFTGDGSHLEAAVEYMSRYRSFPIARLWRAGARAVQKVLCGEALGWSDVVGITHSVGDAPATMRLAAVRALIAAGRLDVAEALVGDDDDPRSPELQEVRDRVGALADPGSGTVAQPLARALLALHRDDVVGADRQLHRALAALATFPWDDAAVDLFELLAITASRHQDHRRAARLLGAAATLRERAGYQHRLQDQQRWVEGVVGAAERAIGAVAYRDEVDRGKELSFADALGYAERPRSPRRRLTVGWDALTPTETKVATLIAEGLTNPQIAQRLLMSRSTVKTHVAHILAKTATASRSELSAAYTRRQRSDGR